MNSLHWNYEADSYRLPLESGEARVKIGKIGNTHHFVARVYDDMGYPLDEQENYFKDFASAEAYIITLAAQLDAQTGSQQADAEKLLSTLEYCLSLLPETHTLHCQRIACLYEWLMSASVPFRMDSVPSQWWDHQFDWQQQDTRFSYPTDYGTLHIDQVKKQGRLPWQSQVLYQVSLEDATGVVLRDNCPPYTEFAQAEHRARQLLEGLEQPYISAHHMPYLQFSCDICRHFLPENASADHFIRLKGLEQRLAEQLQ